MTEPIILVVNLCRIRLQHFHHITSASPPHRHCLPLYPLYRLLLSFSPPEYYFGTRYWHWLQQLLSSGWFDLNQSKISVFHSTQNNGRHDQVVYLEKQLTHPWNLLLFLHPPPQICSELFTSTSQDQSPSRPSFVLPTLCILSRTSRNGSLCFQWRRSARRWESCGYYRPTPTRILLDPFSL